MMKIYRHSRSMKRGVNIDTVVLCEGYSTDVTIHYNYKLVSDSRRVQEEEYILDLLTSVNSRFYFQDLSVLLSNPETT